MIRLKYSKIRGKRLSHLLLFLRSHLMVHRILRTIDLEHFKLFQRKYRDADPFQGYSKYLNIRHWMVDQLVYVYMLKLHKASPLRILDLGCGAGYFSYICSLYGHEVIGIDLDTSPMYNDLCQFFHVKRATWRITKFKNLPELGTKFDLVTAVGVKFNSHNQPDQWGVDEWRFFLEDLMGNQLVENGRIFLSLNANRDGCFYDKSLLKLFTSFGGRVYHRYVDIGGPQPNFVLDFFDRLLMSKVV